MFDEVNNQPYRLTFEMGNEQLPPVAVVTILLNEFALVTGYRIERVPAADEDKHALAVIRLGIRHGLELMEQQKSAEKLKAAKEDRARAGRRVKGTRRKP